MNSKRLDKSASARLLLTLVLVVGAGLALATPGHAVFFLGDLVYCDTNADGNFDGGDFPLNGVVVDIVCTNALGDVCADLSATTGTIHPSVTPLDLANFDQACNVSGGATFDPTDPAQLDGRYLVELTDECREAIPGTIGG